MSLFGICPARARGPVFGSVPKMRIFENFLEFLMISSPSDRRNYGTRNYGPQGCTWKLKKGRFCEPSISGCLAQSHKSDLEASKTQNRFDRNLWSTTSLTRSNPKPWNSGSIFEDLQICWYLRTSKIINHELGPGSITTSEPKPNPSIDLAIPKLKTFRSTTSIP